MAAGNIILCCDELLFNNCIDLLIREYQSMYDSHIARQYAILTKVRESYHRYNVLEPERWMEAYSDIVFFQLYRLQKATFVSLVEVLLTRDQHQLLKKKYRGGNYPVVPEKSVLIFLWYMSKQDTLNSIAERFRVVPSTIMQIVNAILYISLHLKTTYICWPETEAEFTHIRREFTSYPGVIGAVDGTHINIKVPIDQQDSYIDRFLSHSINLMAVCTSHKIFTYIFVGFPGAAHDARVFACSALVRLIEQQGRHRYFPSEHYHLLGDSAFPIRTWLMKPFRNGNLTRIQRHHNYVLSRDRVCIENAFGILKGRWQRLKYINTYSISKAVEITTAACILHNFCYLHNDEWEGEQWADDTAYEEFIDNHYENREEQRMGKAKRDRIAQLLFDYDNQ